MTDPIDGLLIDAQQLTQNTREIALTVIASLLGQGHPEVHTTRVDRRNPLLCSVSIAGAWNGNVLVSLSPRLAEWMAHRMFGAASNDNAGNDNAGSDKVHSAADNSDAREATREISNIVAGNLKPLFGPDHALGLPQDIDDAAAVMTEATGSNTPLVHVVVHHHGEALEIQVLPRD